MRQFQSFLSHQQIRVLGTEIRFLVREYILSLDGKKGGIKRVHRTGYRDGFSFLPVTHAPQLEEWSIQRLLMVRADRAGPLTVCTGWRCLPKPHPGQLASPAQSDPLP